MRILLGWAWTYLVVAELIGEKSGISAFIYQQQRYRHFDNVYASIIMIGLIGLLSDQILAWVGRYLFPWESGNQGLNRFVHKVRRWLSPKASLKQAAESST
jgi:NitT/TauT family transport system permease protein